MAKRKKHSSKSKKHKLTPRQQRKKQPSAPRFYQSEWFKGILSSAVLIAGCIGLLNYNAGYKRLHGHIADLHRDMRERADETNEQKMQYLFGSNYRYLDFVKQNTPDDAVILFPPHAIIYPKNQKAHFGKWMNAKSYTSYFLYPRKIIYDNKKDKKSALYAQVTHVAIINSWGYEKLNYTVAQQEQYTVLPLNQ